MIVTPDSRNPTAVNSPISALLMSQEKHAEIMEMIRANCGLDRDTWKFIDNPKATFQVNIGDYCLPIIIR